MDTSTSEPEFCPNPSCRFHSRTTAAEYQWYIRFGRFETEARGAIQRFRCRGCGKTCSTQTFSVHYWTHSTNDLVWLLHHLYGANGQRATGRFAGASHRVIQNRIRRLARNCLAVMDLAIERFALMENLAMDGFESFTRSKYHPNNITGLVGAQSEFIYAAVHTLLRRKGAMSPGQRACRSLIDSVWSPATTTRQDCQELLADASDAIGAACERRGELRLATDRHRDYRPALLAVPLLASELAQGRLEHLQVSSRAARTRSNPLFPVNYVDRQLRAHLAEHGRRTIRHAREVNCQMERMAIFMVLHNFLSPYRVSGHACVATAPTHARVATVYGPELTEQLARVITHRHVHSHCRAGQQWIERIWLHRYHNPPAVRVKKGKLIVRKVALGPGELPKHFIA